MVTKDSLVASPSTDSFPIGLGMRVAYDGRGFAGWQHQPGQRTVQGVLQEAAACVADHTVVVRGTSRTDAGVHAEGQVAAFDTSRVLPAERWVMALNTELPSDVAVCEVFFCDSGYDPRFDAKEKTYRYALYVASSRHPLMEGRHWQWRTKKLNDLQKMEEALQCFVGTHDFCAFRSVLDRREVTERTITKASLSWKEQYEGVTGYLEIVGNGFMHNMVRIIAGTVVEVGCGRLALEKIPELLRTGAKRTEAGPTAPPFGLTLVSIELGKLAANR